MISLYNFNHSFKKGMLEITPDVEVEDIWKYLLPMSTEKLPDGIGFSVVKGDKQYDIIRLHEGGQRFFSQKVITGQGRVERGSFTLTLSQNRA